MKDIDLSQFRPLYLPGAMLVVALVLWLVAIPVVKGYHERTAGVVDQLQTELQSLRTETLRKQSEADQLRRTIGDYDRLIAEGIAVPQDRLLAAATIERLAKLHNLGTPRFTIGAENPIDGPQYKAGDIGVVAAEIIIEAGGLLDTQLIDFLQAVRSELPGRTQFVTVSLEKAAIVPVGPQLAAGGTNQVLARGTATLLWRTIRLPAAPNKAAAK